MKISFLRSGKMTVVALATIATLLFFILKPGYYLTISDAGDGRIYRAFLVKNGDWFRIQFIHSVNKSPVIDCYEIKDHAVYVEKTIYYSFGAGVQAEVGDGQKLEYGEDGSMVVSGFDQRMDDLTYFVGTVSDHIFEYKGENISLRELCGRNAKVRFAVHFYPRRPF